MGRGTSRAGCQEVHVPGHPAASELSGYRGTFCTNCSIVMAGILVKSSSGFQPRVKLQSCHWKARPYLRTFRELSDIAARIEQNMLVPLTQIWRSGKTLSSLIFIIYFSVISWIIQPGDDVGFELFGGLRPFLHSRGWQTLAHGPRLAHQPCLFRWSAKCSSTFLRSVGDEDEETALLWCGRPER